MKRLNLAGLISMIVLLYPLSYGPAMRLTLDRRKHYQSMPRAFAICDPMMSVPVLRDVLSYYSYLCTRDLEPSTDIFG